MLHVCCVTLSVPLTAFKEKLSLTFLVLKVIKKIVVEGYETRLRRGRKMISWEPCIRDTLVEKSTLVFEWKTNHVSIYLKNDVLFCF